MDKINVLLVEDENTLAMIIKDTLEAQGFVIATAKDGEEGLQMFFRRKPDILVADVMMPRMDGFEMVRRIRMTDPITPVLFLTARSAINDVVAGFDSGANDYLKKPFGMQELIARMHALVARTSLLQTATRPSGTERDIRIGSYSLNPQKQQLSRAGTSKPLSYREMQILKMLADNRNNVVETRHILLSLWGDDTFFNSRSLQVFITKLRHQLSADPNVRIINVRGIGYRLIC